MKRLLLLAGLFILFSLYSSAQPLKSIEFEFLPDGMHFQPLKAHVKEARMGVLYNPENAQLKLDIGNSIDLIKFEYGKNIVTFGIEFNAYAHSVNYQNNRLQIDAIDGFFGGNTVFSSSSLNSGFYSRLRAIHNSAHFVDGHFNVITSRWKEDLTPVAFTRDFGELIIAYEWKFEKSSFKIYSGPTYAALVRPVDIRKWSVDAGFEFSITNLLGTFFKKNENLFVAHHLEFFGSPVYQGNNNFVLGLKLGAWNKKGVSIYLNYYNGKNPFNEYYKMRVQKFGIGFNIDFP